MESPNFVHSILVMLALDFHGLWLVPILTGLIMTESCKKEDLASLIEAGWITQVFEVQSNVSSQVKRNYRRHQVTRGKSTLDSRAELYDGINLEFLAITSLSKHVTSSSCGAAG
ncbi:hypothetical protein CRYUN_Cryun01aG0168600 [Craigia yunnanensis]